MDGWMESTSRDMRPQDTVPLVIAGEPPKLSSATFRLSHELPSTRADAKAHRQDGGGSLNMAKT